MSYSLQPTDCTTSGLPVHHQLPEFTQTHAYQVSDAIQPSHPLSSPSITFSLSQLYQSGSFPMSQFFVLGGQSIGVSASASVSSNEYLGLISFRMDWLDLLAVQQTLKSLLQHHNSKSINFLALSFLHSPTLTSIHDHWKNHSLDQMDLCWQSNVSTF